MYKLRSVGNGRWELDGVQNSEYLSGLVIHFMEGKIERNGSTSYYIAGPAFATIKVTFPDGRDHSVENVPVQFD